MAFKRSAVRSRLSPPHFASLYGGIAQLGEHLLCKQGVSGSIPLTSTKFFKIYTKVKHSIILFLDFSRESFFFQKIVKYMHLLRPQRTYL